MDAFLLMMLAMIAISFVGVVAEKDKHYRAFLLVTFMIAVLAFLLIAYFT